MLRVDSKRKKRKVEYMGNNQKVQEDSPRRIAVRRMNECVCVCARGINQTALNLEGYRFKSRLIASKQTWKILPGPSTLALQGKRRKVRLGVWILLSVSTAQTTKGSMRWSRAASCSVSLGRTMGSTGTLGGKETRGHGEDRRGKWMR